MPSFSSLELGSAIGHPLRADRIMRTSESHKILCRVKDAVPGATEGKEAEKAGILSKQVSSESLEKEARAIAARIAKGPPIAIKPAKMQFYKGLEISNLEAALQYTAVAFIKVRGQP